MQGLMPLSFSIMAGICLFAAINHFMIGRKSPDDDKVHIAFSFLCFFSFLVYITIIQHYDAKSAEQLIEINDFQIVLTSGCFISMLWFVRLFASATESKVFNVLVSAHIFFIASAIFKPFGNIIIHNDGISASNLSWIQSPPKLINPQYSVLEGLFFINLYASYFYAAYCSTCSYRKHHKKSTIVLLVAIILYIIFLSIDSAIFIASGSNTYLSAFCFLPFLFLMSSHMTGTRHSKIVSDSEEKYRRLIETIRDDYIVLTFIPNGECTYISRSVEKILGYSPDMLYGLNWQKQNNLHSIQALVDYYFKKSSWQSGASVGMETAVLDKNNNPVLFDVILYKMEDSDGNITLVEGFARDITKQRAHENKLLEFNADLEFRVNERTEELQAALSELRHEVNERSSLNQQLMQSQKMESIGQLAGGVAHDFNNIMTVIAGFSEMAINENRKGNNVSEDLEQILDAAKRGSKLTEQLLGFARKQVATPKIVNPNDVMAEAMNFLPRMIAANSEIIFNPSDIVWHIKVDPVQLDQILVNLVVNARDALSKTASDNEINISIKNLSAYSAQLLSEAQIPVSDYVCISVSDNGSGIPSDIQQKIFEPFFTTKVVGKGSGLGLSVCYGVVKQYGGFIFVDSDLSHGTTFHVLFPRVVFSDVQVPNTLQTAFVDENELIDGNETLLLVEDDAVVALLTSKILATSGYKVITASNGLEGLDLVEKHSGDIDLVITDLMMPKMNGYELVDTLRLLFPDLGIICVSGYAESESLIELRHKNITFLPKPYSPLQLVRAVRFVLKSRMKNAVLNSKNGELNKTARKIEVN